MKVTFDNVYNAFQIIAPKGTMISFTGEPTALADGVYLVGDDGIINLDEQFLTDTLYLSTEGTDYAVTGGMRVTYPLGDETVIIRAGSSTIPFSKGGKGGGGSGGDNTHYKGTTTTPISNGSTTNPITIDGEEYTAVFGDIVVYGYTEFVFDGSAWSEFGRPFDTTPTSGSANAVTSDGIYKRTPFARNTNGGAQMGGGTASGVGGACIAVGSYSTASGINSFAFGTTINANQTAMMAIGTANNPRSGDLFNIGNGGNASTRSNIVEVNRTSFNVNGDIKKNNVSLPTPYTTMPTITEEMVGQIAMYVGETTNDYVKGYFYIASSDGAAEPTYSWVSMVDSTPTSGSKNFVTSNGVYQKTPWARGVGVNSTYGGLDSSSAGNYSIAYGRGIKTPRSCMAAFGQFNTSNAGDLFAIGNGTADNARSNIIEVNAAQVNINGDIKRDGVGIDDYTTTERKIGKWIDGSDLYQRTFEVTGLTKNDRWVFNNNILGTSDIDIKDFKGYTEWSDGTNTTRHDLNFYLSNSIHSLCLNAVSDLAISLNHESTTSFVKAIITIKYTKPSVQANLLQTAPTEGISETPTVEEDDMR